jgi:hypothetical protein
MKAPDAPPGCTGCYWDDYVDKWRYVAECMVHGLRKFDAVHKYGSPNCKCEKTGPERTWNNALDCPLHGPQEDFVPKVRKAMENGVGNTDAAPASYDPPPDHYSTGAGIDPWQVWDAFGLDKDAYLANAVKYILRAGKKDIAPRLDDLIKARNYINKAIEKESSREA